ncbi:hypothetical protein ACVWZV_008161 [Bradyrhizobium sp. GM5.1]
MGDRGRAGRLVIAMVLVQAERDVWIGPLQRIDHVREHEVAGIAARAARSLDDDGRVDLGRRLHDRDALLHVVDVERRHRVAVTGGVVEQLTKSDTGHDKSSCYCLPARAIARRAASATPCGVMPNSR